MAKKNDQNKKEPIKGKSENKLEKTKKINLSENKKRDTDDTGPRDKK
jgi:hypothetical protein